MIPAVEPWTLDDWSPTTDVWMRDLVLHAPMHRVQIRVLDEDDVWQITTGCRWQVVQGHVLELAASAEFEPFACVGCFGLPLPVVG